MSDFSKAIRKIEKLSPKPGDILLVRYKNGTPPDVLKRMVAYVQELATRTKATILFVNDDQDLKLLNDHDMNLAGWIRKPSILHKGGA